MNNIKIVNRNNGDVICEKINSPKDNVHLYERQPYTRTVLVRNRKGELVSLQTCNQKAFKYKVIYKGLVTIVIFENGCKGIARCKPTDVYSIQIGHDIAYNRANIQALEKEIKELSF